MTLLMPNGRPISRNIEKYRINWDGKSLSKIQQTVKLFLKPYWQFNIVYEEAPLPGTRLQVDILNATKKIAIEVQGKQHHNFNKFYHNNSRAKYLKSIKNDMFKYECLTLNKYKLIEINEGEEKLLSREFFKEKFGVLL